MRSRANRKTRVRCVRGVMHRCIGAVKLDADSWKLVLEREPAYANAATENRGKGDEDKTERERRKRRSAEQGEEKSVVLSKEYFPE